MSVTSIDAVTAFTPPPRQADPSSRAGDVERSFGPALERAYKEERPRETPAAKDASSKRDDGPAPPQVKSPESRHDEHGQRSDESEPAAENVAAGHEASSDQDDRPADDAAEISEEGAAAAAAAGEQVKPAKEVKVAAHVKDTAEKIAAAAKTGAEKTPAPKEESGAGDGQTKGEADAAEATGDLKGQVPAGDKSASDKAREASTKQVQPTNDQQAKANRAAKETAEPQQGGANAEHAATVTTATSVQSKGQSSASAEPTSPGAPSSKTAAKKSDSDDDKSVQQVTDKASGAATTAATQQVDQSSAAADAIAAPNVITPIESSKEQGASRPKAEAIGSANSSSRSTATLDRLAARAMRSGDSDNQTTGGTAVDRTRFVQRVEGAVRAAQQRDGRIQVRLSPPELGNLKIELAVQNGVMTAKLEAETPAARNALLDNLPALRERLAQQDIRVEKFEVDIRRDSGGSAGNGGAFDKQSGQPDSGRQDARPRPATTIAAAPAARQAAAASSATNAALDVRI
jgi:flagellar hook-length control protein FliK